MTVVDCPKAITLVGDELKTAIDEAYQRGFAAGVAAPRVVRVILTVTIDDALLEGFYELRPRRYIIESGADDTTIVRDGRPLVERDRSVAMGLNVPGVDPGLGGIGVFMAVERDPTT